MSLTWATPCKYPGSTEGSQVETAGKQSRAPFNLFKMFQVENNFQSLLILERATKGEQFHLYLGKVSLRWWWHLASHSFRAEVCARAYESGQRGPRPLGLVLEPDVASGCCSCVTGFLSRFFLFPHHCTASFPQRRVLDTEGTGRD